MKRHSLRNALIILALLSVGLSSHADGMERQYLVALSRRIDQGSLSAIGARVASDLTDVLVVTIDESHLELLRSYPGVKYVQLVIRPGDRHDQMQPDLESRSTTMGQHQATTAATWGPVAFEYDGAGNIKTIGPDTYWYDGSNRLVHAGVSSHTQDFTYDGFGNLQTMTTDALPRSLATAASTNRLNAQVYDVAGNVTTDDAGYQYRYDAFNMIQDKRQGLEVYVYNSADERIASLRNGQWYWTLRDETGKVLREYRSSDSSPSAPALWLGDHVWRNGMPVGAQRMAQEGGTRHYHLDHLGSARLVTGANGAKISQHDYYPFGREITPMNQGTQANMREDQFRFTGHERDWNSGTVTDNTDYVDYMHARYYNPNGARFLSVDAHPGTPEVPQSWNRYSYTFNNPVKAIDPDGLETIVMVARDYLIGDHSAVAVVRGEDRVLYDPDGAFTPDSMKARGESRTAAMDKFYGDDARIDSWLHYQRNDGGDVSIVVFKTTPKEEQQIRQRIENQPDSAKPFGCATNVSLVLNGIGPFKDLGQHTFPRGLLWSLKKMRARQNDTVPRPSVGPRATNNPRSWENHYRPVIGTDGGSWLDCVDGSCQ